jgi:hypothetical protein
MVTSHHEAAHRIFQDRPEPHIWRNLMAVGSYFPGRGTLVEEKFLAGKEQGRAEARAEERAQLVLRVLEHRGIAAAPDAKERVTECTDLEILERWMDRAFTVTSADALFEDAG